MGRTTGEQFDRRDSGFRRSIGEQRNRITSYRKIIDLTNQDTGIYDIPSKFQCRGMSYDDDGDNNDQRTIKLRLRDDDSYSNPSYLKQIIHPMELVSIDWSGTTARDIHLYA